MNLQLTYIIMFCLLIMSCQQQHKGEPITKEVDVPSGEFQLVWSDEFDTDGLPDSTKWGYDLGNGCPNVCGWGNQELEYYTQRPENARVENGNLIIEAIKERYDTMDYTSARLITKGKGDWKYGRVEVRAKLPIGVGTWPAIWMLPTDWEYGGWPKSGEIDIMEHVGHEAGRIFGTVHTESYNHIKGTEVGDEIHINDVDTAFHTYTIEWEADKIKWFVDDKMYFEFENEYKTSNEWPFNKRFYLILNIAIGGNLGGVEGVDDSVFPQRMVVDYVRIYQRS